MRILDQSVDPASSCSPRFTEKQGQYLAFIHTYTLLNRRPPAEADFQRFFEVTPPTIHQMIVALERRPQPLSRPRSPQTDRPHGLAERALDRADPAREGALTPLGLDERTPRRGSRPTVTARAAPP
jgi:repressor LexA